MTHFGPHNRQNADIIEKRTRLLHAAAVAYRKEPSESRLYELSRVVEMTRSIVNDEVSDHSGVSWSRRLR